VVAPWEGAPRKKSVKKGLRERVVWGVRLFIVILAERREGVQGDKNGWEDRDSYGMVVQVRRRKSEVARKVRAQSQGRCRDRKNQRGFAD